MKKAQIPISTVFLFLFGILILSLVVLPKYRDWMEKKKINDNFAEFLKNYHNYLLEVENTINEIESQKENLEKINTILPPDPFIAEYFFLLNQLSQSQGLVLLSFNFSPEKGTFSSPQENQLVALPHSIEAHFRGNYSSVKSFISSLESLARLTSIKEIQLKSELIQQKEEKVPSLQETTEFRAKVEIYSLPSN